MYIDLNNVKREKMVIENDIFRLEHDDWMSEYEKDLASGNIIMINDSKIIKEGMKPNYDESIFDSRFNIPIETDNKITEYACNCERVVGRYNEGVVCPNCNTVVELKYSIELLRRGWIDLGDYKIIVPAIYKKIKSYLTKKRLDEMIHYDPNNPLHQKIDSANPYRGIGIVEFERKYVEILNYYKNITTKPELYQILMDRKNITFSSKIYVMSSAHRPIYVSAREKSVQFHDMNKLFVKTLADLNLIKKGRRTGRKAVEIISNIQQYLMQIHDLVINKIKGKEKLIRSSIISGRLWYSSRMVIISETEIDDIDSVRMSYKGFLGMFELEIMNAMLRGYGNPEFAKMTTAECRIYLTKCKFSNKIDESIYSIIKSLIHDRKDDGVWVIINRNPSFDLGSLQTFRVADVFEDAEKNVLTIPHNSLMEFTGDFDGDVLNVYSPKEKCVIEAFKEGFRPSKLILDRSGGYYNSKMTPIKDEYSFMRTFLDKDYKPINPSKVKLKKLEDILNKVDNSFDYYNMIKALDDIKTINEEITKNNYFDCNNVFVYDPLNTEHSNGEFEEEFIESKTVFDPLNKNSSKLSYDPFDIVDRNDFLACS